MKYTILVVLTLFLSDDTYLNWTLSLFMPTKDLGKIFFEMAVHIFSINSYIFKIIVYSNSTKFLWSWLMVHNSYMNIIFNVFSFIWYGKFFLLTFVIYLEQTFVILFIKFHSGHKFFINHLVVWKFKQFDFTFIPF